MAGDAFFAIFPILTLFFYVAPIIFLVWFLIRFLKIQQEKTQILKAISGKLDKLVK
ncbi:hypothetical protein L2D08_21980 [Domibacillus sp. PGB-M46]|uniref:hypothetical protein n=1 Tax=Domibacillus sp. PGB-M46 TaxID=2910255 RepID=UPI001F59A62F|nr:hypothetical protein [Domibacillus sp. PGB-M46]MCI2256999.1 hypothetical protein [Domibacillus sp. PGB-M46]